MEDDDNTAPVSTTTMEDDDNTAPVRNRYSPIKPTDTVGWTAKVRELDKELRYWVQKKAEAKANMIKAEKEASNAVAFVSKAKASEHEALAKLATARTKADKAKAKADKAKAKADKAEEEAAEAEEAAAEAGQDVTEAEERAARAKTTRETQSGIVREVNHEEGISRSLHSRATNKLENAIGKTKAVAALTEFREAQKAASLKTKADQKAASPEVKGKKGSPESNKVQKKQKAESGKAQTKKRAYSPKSDTQPPEKQAKTGMEERGSLQSNSPQQRAQSHRVRPSGFVVQGLDLGNEDDIQIIRFKVEEEDLPPVGGLSVPVKGEVMPKLI